MGGPGGMLGNQGMPQGQVQSCDCGEGMMAGHVAAQVIFGVLAAAFLAAATAALVALTIFLVRKSRAPAAS
jgi:hypothetical protein